MARDLKAEQKFIEDMSDSIPATGDWKAARVIHRIVARDGYSFRMPERTFHSILSVIRRHRAKQKAVKYAGKFFVLGSGGSKSDTQWFIRDGVTYMVYRDVEKRSRDYPTVADFQKAVDSGELVKA